MTMNTPTAETGSQLITLLASLMLVLQLLLVVQQMLVTNIRIFALQSLLLDWCDALLQLQIDAPSNTAEHGAFRCPSCDFLHGRCSDAVYPLLAAARLTKSARYQQAAIRVVEWSRNVDAPDGSWTNEIDPKSWKGTTVFAALARVEWRRLTPGPA